MIIYRPLRSGLMFRVDEESSNVKIGTDVMDAERLGCCFAKRIPNLNSKPDRATIQGFRRHKECVELSKYCQNKVLDFFCSSL